MKREARLRIAQRTDVCREAEVEQHVRLVEDQRMSVHRADRASHKSVERRQLAVELGAAARQGAGQVGRARKRLVEQLVAEHARYAAEAGGDVPPRGGVVVL